jgi:hypothetical protein
MTGMDDVFTSLFFGTGAWLGLLIIIAFVVGITFMWKYTGLVMLPVAVIFGTVYLDNSLGWHALIMFLVSIFIMWKISEDARK